MLDGVAPPLSSAASDAADSDACSSAGQLFGLSGFVYGLPASLPDSTDPVGRFPSLYSSGSVHTVPDDIPDEEYWWEGSSWSGSGNSSSSGWSGPSGSCSVAGKEAGDGGMPTALASGCAILHSFTHSPKLQ